MSTGMPLGDLPLVSLMIVCWNYQGYVGETLSSVRSQDYPNLEIVAVDNGSTDASTEIMREHARADGRIRVIQLERNLGQLGAFMQVFPELTGEFVTLVDADDTLYPRYVSTHVQAHLAALGNSALSTSNLFQIDGDGRVITGQYDYYGRATTDSVRGLRAPEHSVRLPVVSDDEYARISGATFQVRAFNHWNWGPGTSTMYRRSALEMIHRIPENPVWMRSADDYLSPLCDLFGDSLFIDLPLSSYRIHAGNYFSGLESNRWLLPSGVDAGLAVPWKVADLIETIASRAGEFASVFGDWFWGAFDRLLVWQKVSYGLVPLHPDLFAVFSRNYRTLCDVFGEVEVVGHLSEWMHEADVVRVVAAGERLATG